MKINVKNIKLSDRSRLYLRHPGTQQFLLTASGERMYIELYGAHSERYKSVMRKWQNEALKQRKIKVTAEQSEQRGHELLASITADWNLEGGDDQPIPLSMDAAMAIYSDPENDWIRAQCDEHVFDQANYLGESFAA
jgi:hypothetical protein